MTSDYPLKRDKLVPTLTIGFITSFILAALLDLDRFKALIQSLFSASANTFGPFWQWLLVLNLATALCLAVSRYGKLKLGNQNTPDIGTFRWLAMIMCTLLAGGGVFWSAAEPFSTL